VHANQGILRTTKEARADYMPDCRLISAASAAGSTWLFWSWPFGKRQVTTAKKKGKICDELLKAIFDLEDAS
jgi:hypothetical protein